jgi:hypothetical protein
MKIYNPKTKKHATVTDSVGHRALKDGWVKADAELVAPEIVKPKKQTNAKLPKETKTEEVISPAVESANQDDEMQNFINAITQNDENAD